MKNLTKEQRDKILELTHKNYQSRAEIEKNLLEIVGEPKDWEDKTRIYLATETIYIKRWISRGTKTSEFHIIEEDVETIFKKQVKYCGVSLCCKLKKDLLLYLKIRQKGGMEAVIVSRFIQAISVKFSLVVIIGDIICSDCQNLRGTLIEFIQRREKVPSLYENGKGHQQ